MSRCQELPYVYIVARSVLEQLDALCSPMSAQNRRVKNLKADGETLTRAATARDGELVIETVPLQRAHSATDKDPRQRFWGSFTKGQKGSQRQLTQAALQVAPAIAVNLRDIGKVSDIVKSGILFRSSELIRYQLLHTTLTNVEKAGL